MRSRIRRLPFALFAILSVALLAKGCASPITNRNPTGELFPEVVGESLDEERVVLPSAFSGSPAVLLVGYEQEAQFDIDRWLMGLLQAEVEAAVVEVPTIPGLVPTLISNWIDDGMRSGIPSEDWGSVVTLYGGAAKPVARLTGNQNGRNARVLVLDQSGTVVWFTDEGYSARAALTVARLARELAAPGEPRD